MRTVLWIALLFVCLGIKAQSEDLVGSTYADQEGFSFVFMTDIHLQPERGAQEAFQKVIDTVNKLHVDFVLTGGDLVYDALRGNFNRSDSLFRTYSTSIKKFDVPVYNTIGNHELFGIYRESDIKTNHPDYKYGMYERYLGKRYYSFDHKGWHFISLCSIEEKDQRYIGLIDDEQKQWLKDDLAQLDTETPIVLSTHIPFISTYNQRYPKNKVKEVPNELWIYNRDEILKLFNDLDLKLVLQGHMHWIEDINLQNKTRFITGGSVAGRPSWRRKNNRNDGIHYDEEGFMVIHVKNGNISWNYIDNKWESRLEPDEK
ncbi:metallophosphoesterase [Maribacter sp. PR1]|uniref:Metallophosphoesterase n=1 Tax=Maribacter cobaltidurans TaxID=1178778 RepID=A0ABU7IXU8_9FLAO|nr:MULTISPECIES: metallophosphoesterase [Maribacter]MDC6390425.1 metallophosphoesterase [Maribacter sp. PR1]MEE1977814.1 metallophosphoesterase [Maribacter cobaltidurans]|tara:strand:+ start:9429 stop:10376 length:948 start_codon:yes stop_codon:yes gene_type:complete